MLSPEEIQERKRDFIAAYRRPEPPEPFFGFFKIQEYHEKYSAPTNGYKYTQVQYYLDRGLNVHQIAFKMGTTVQRVKRSIRHINEKNRL